MRLSSPHINIILKACTKASRSLIRDYGEIEKMLEQITDHVENDPGNKIVD